MMQHIRTSLLMIAILTVITGMIYPLVVTAIGSAFFPVQASGSLVNSGPSVVGSSLIGQSFTGARYFHGRPSATGYQLLPTGGSNAGPTSEALWKMTLQRRKEFLSENLLAPESRLPDEMVSASGSGCDPDISPEAARLQVSRVARARGFDDHAKNLLAGLVERHITPRQFGLLGEARVNVLLLNLALDSLRL